MISRSTATHLTFSSAPRYDAGRIQISLTTLVAAGQAAELLLNPHDARLPLGRVIAGPPASAATSTLVFPATNVPSGVYFVCVRVDGVETLLEIDRDPTSPTYGSYVGPMIFVP